MKGMCAYNRRHVGYIVPTCWDAAPSKNQGWVIQRWFCMPVAFGMERLSIDPFVYSIYSYVYPDLHPPRTAQKQRYQLSHLSNTGIGWARWAVALVADGFSFSLQHIHWQPRQLARG